MHEEGVSADSILRWNLEDFGFGELGGFLGHSLLWLLGDLLLGFLGRLLCSCLLLDRGLLDRRFPFRLLDGGSRVSTGYSLHQTRRCNGTGK